jgi:hypothetical protein
MDQYYFLLSYLVRVSSERERNMFQCFKVKPWGCPEYHQSYDTKAIIHQFMISQDAVLMQISLNIKIAGHLKKTSINVKQSNISKSYTCRTNEQVLHDKIILDLPQQTSEGGNNTKTRTCQFYVKIVICMNSKAQWNVSLMQHNYSLRGSQFKSSSRWCIQMAWRNRFSLERRSLLCKMWPSYFKVLSIKCQCILICDLIIQLMM